MAKIVQESTPDQEVARSDLYRDIDVLRKGSFSKKQDQYRLAGKIIDLTVSLAMECSLSDDEIQEALNLALQKLPEEKRQAACQSVISTITEALDLEEYGPTTLNDFRMLFEVASSYCTQHVFCDDDISIIRSIQDVPKEGRLAHIQSILIQQRKHHNQNSLDVAELMQRLSDLIDGFSPKEQLHLGSLLLAEVDYYYQAGRLATAHALALTEKIRLLVLKSSGLDQTGFQQVLRSFLDHVPDDDDGRSLITTGTLGNLVRANHYYWQSRNQLENSIWGMLKGENGSCTDFVDQIQEFYNSGYGDVASVADYLERFFAKQPAEECAVFLKEQQFFLENLAHAVVHESEDQSYAAEKLAGLLTTLCNGMSYEIEGKVFVSEPIEGDVVVAFRRAAAPDFKEEPLVVSSVIGFNSVGEIVAPLGEAMQAVNDYYDGGETSSSRDREAYKEYKSFLYLAERHL